MVGVCLNQSKGALILDHVVVGIRLGSHEYVVQHRIDDNKNYGHRINGKLIICYRTANSYIGHSSVCKNRKICDNI